MYKDLSLHNFKGLLCHKIQLKSISYNKSLFWKIIMYTYFTLLTFIALFYFHAEKY